MDFDHTRPGARAEAPAPAEAEAGKPPAPNEPVSLQSLLKRFGIK
jgi:hypothetical protein